MNTPTEVSTNQETKKAEMRAKVKQTFWKSVRKNWRLYVLFFLPFLYLIIFKYYPMYGAIISFKNFNPVEGIWGSPWVGLDHFIRFIQSYEFFRVMKNTLLLSAYQLLAGFPVPIILALMINSVLHSKFKKTVQMITYAPHFISVVVIVGMIIVFLAPRGPVNALLGQFGIDAINFMGEPQLFKSIFVWSGVWQNAGFSCIVYLAALAGVNPQLHEAAIMDGASKLQRIRYIDIPKIIPVTIILMLLDLGNFLDIGFEKVLLMQNSLNLSASEVIDTFVYKIGIANGIPQYSYAAAIGIFKSVIAFILIFGMNKLAKKLGQESLW